MRLASLTDGQQRLLTRFTEAGGVVEFLILDCDGNVSDGRLHHAAVLYAFSEIQRQAVFQVNIDNEAAKEITPRQVTWKEFLGPRYDFERDGLIVRGKGDFLNEFFYFRDRATRDNIISPDGIDYGIGTGFAYAFSSPPYRIQLPVEELGELFDKFVRFIVCGSDKSFILQWPTDWSNYFEAGDEWWGSFLWSISSPDSSRIVVVLASTTD